MLKNITGEITVQWNDKSTVIPLKGALIKLMILSLVAVLFTSIIAFVFLAISFTGFITLIVLSVAGLGATAHFGKEYLTGLVFREKTDKSESSQAAEGASQQDSTVSK